MSRTSPAYEALLTQLRQAFPQPVSDQVHDAYLVFSILRALDQVDQLKSQAPILGRPTRPDYAAARRSQLADAPQSLEAVVPQLVRYLEGLLIWGHPRTQVNVIQQPGIAGIIGTILPATYNPNLCSEESGHLLAEAEVRVAAMIADLVGYDPLRATGAFTFGGTGCTLYGVKVGLEKALPGTLKAGLSRPAVVLASDQSHYCVQNVAAWLGLGSNRVRRVPTGPDNAILLPELEQTARAALDAGEAIAAIVVTLGTTDAFGLDDLAGVCEIRDRLASEYRLPYLPHIHADAVIGWAWSVFNDYDIVANPLGFRGRTVRALAAATRRIGQLSRADSLGVDFHKTGYAPYISSLVLFKERADWERIGRPPESMPYLYHSGEYHPGMQTLETSRAGTSMLAALGSLLSFGKEGLRTLLGHAVEMAETLREGVEAHPNLTVLNDLNHGPVTLMRVYPDNVDTFTIKLREQTDPSLRGQVRLHNIYNRRIYEYVQSEALAGRGIAISLTDCYRSTDYGEPLVALKSYVLSPFVEERHMREIIEHVLAARTQIDIAAIENEQADKTEKESTG
ncbi:MAG: pyridoxal-dependent decarboxylase [Pirellulales bacterium]|nr:pyridoxal-dependent decarboxylase [Pirellulales bacterium]